MPQSTRREIPADTLLRSQPLFQGVEPATLARLAASATRRPLARGERLFSKGDLPTGMYLVVYGTIRFLSPGPRGERLTGVAGAGRSFGEPVMFLNRPAVVHAVAAEDSLVLHLSREAVVAEIARNPGLALQMLGTMSERVEGLVSQLERQATGGGRERVIQFLARHAPSAAPHVVTLPSTKASIASQLLVTPEHFSRLLRELADEGLVTVEGRRVSVPDLPRLQQALEPRKAVAPTSAALDG
jgi:CRP-like cAMP-binding protein